MIKKIILVFILIITSINVLYAEEYFSILKYDKVNLRQGPAKNNPIKCFLFKLVLFNTNKEITKIPTANNIALVCV